LASDRRRFTSTRSARQATSSHVFRIGLIPIFFFLPHPRRPHHCRSTMVDRFLPESALCRPPRLPSSPSVDSGATTGGVTDGGELPHYSPSARARRQRRLRDLGSNRGDREMNELDGVRETTPLAFIRIYDGFKPVRFLILLLPSTTRITILLMLRLWWSPAPRYTTVLPPLLGRVVSHLGY
jgi:hypothetical protein